VHSFYNFKLSNPTLQELADEFISGKQNIVIVQLNQLYDQIKVDDYCFISLAGDIQKMSKAGSEWERGLAGIAKISKAPYDKGYDTSTKNTLKNFKIQVSMYLVLPHAMEKKDFIPYENAYDSAGIGPSTRGEQNQAIKKLEEKQSIAVVRAIIDKYPNLENTIDDLFDEAFLTSVKDYMNIRILENKRFIGKGPSDMEKGENLIYYGIPGSGKSHKIEKNYNLTDQNFERIVFHQDYDYSDFIGQILPSLSEDRVVYSFEPGPFTRILKKSFENLNENYYLIIEEINRGNAPSIFGDIFQLLDRKATGDSDYSITNRKISTYIWPSEPDKKVFIPQNLFIVATMNTSDQNVFTLDTAFKRRWKMIRIKNDLNTPAFANTIIHKTDITWKNFATRINEEILNENSIDNEDKCLGAFFINEEELSDINLFSQKVLSFLWSDVFKFNRSQIFDLEKNSSFDDILSNANEDFNSIFTIDFPKESENNLAQ
jgi:MoxR-like ATPase